MPFPLQKCFGFDEECIRAECGSSWEEDHFGGSRSSMKGVWLRGLVSTRAALLNESVAFYIRDEMSQVRGCNRLRTSDGVDF